MADQNYATYQHYGTAAERAAFTPDPPISLPFQPIYLWYESDTTDLYLYNGTAWVLISVSGGGGGTLLTADPGAPANDTWWVRRTGVSPTMDVALRVRVAGTTYTIASITI